MGHVRALSQDGGDLGDLGVGGFGWQKKGLERTEGFRNGMFSTLLYIYMVRSNIITFYQ